MQTYIHTYRYTHTHTYWRQIADITQDIQMDLGPWGVLDYPTGTSVISIHTTPGPLFAFFRKPNSFLLLVNFWLGTSALAWYAFIMQPSTDLRADTRDRHRDAEQPLHCKGCLARCPCLCTASRCRATLALQPLHTLAQCHAWQPAWYRLTTGLIPQAGSMPHASIACAWRRANGSPSPTSPTSWSCLALLSYIHT